MDNIVYCKKDDFLKIKMEIDTSIVSDNYEIAFNLFIERVGNLDNLQRDEFFRYYKNLLFDIAKLENNK
jgi:hypothetical protein